MSDLDDDLNVDLTPLIDVIFMLVIFFIMTMSFTLPVIDFDLPQSSTAQAEQQGRTMRISVDINGNYIVDEQERTLDELNDLVKERMVTCQQDHEDLTLELVIDSQSPTQYLINIADLARAYTQGRLIVVSEKVDNNFDPTAAAQTIKESDKVN
ncbi:biopolymer transporter ExbD [Anaerobiospirillum sp. NML120448]|uniref:ExbD/TolR family protein n=1 Tax=Anaerobiospirillum sp. NML120448 TaxID=2932816 RepID=UPI001FF43C1B|nr:biopolymer transporter ExbD [Anaerobiospirillum sp. NML120448]MCK0513350.1 biopolymer transporter ExbD [Anaerobiospirillum sp. NML120448]